MKFNIVGYTDEQLQTALDFANIDNAIELWQRKDWAVYQETRKGIWAIQRELRLCGYVGTPQTQFTWFVFTHLKPRFPPGLTEWRMFTLDLPPGRTTDEPSWAVATAGEFWNVII
jgi:hypothetical protein